MEYLILMEVGKKQSYIFKSNKLKENIGASQIIQYVTEKLPQNRLNDFNGIEVMRGGGKSLYSFKDEQNGIEFIKNISKKIIEEFPGLDVYFVKDIFDEKNHNFADKIEELYVLLGNKKSLKKNSLRQISLGIEKVCRSTGLPASYYKEDEVISEEIHVKREFAEKKIDISIISEREEQFVKKLDDLREDDNSYISVIHIDGNSMGSKFVDLANYYRKLINKDKSYNKEYLNAMYKLSSEIEKIYTKAFNKVIDASIVDGKATIRPIIFAGDDVTFICKATDSIRLTKIFLEEVMSKQVEVGTEIIKLNAAAGIAFTKSHYPFSRAYDLAEELCSNCKSYLKKVGKDSSMLDWHILQGETSDSLQEIRRSQYKAKDGLILNLRPLYINNSSEINNLNNFIWSLNHVQKDADSRKKMKDLRTEYTKGIEAVNIFMNYYRLSEKFDYLNNKECTNGILGNTAIFFDAIEIMDLVKEV